MWEKAGRMEHRRVKICALSLYKEDLKRAFQRRVNLDAQKQWAGLLKAKTSLSVKKS